MFSWKFNFSSHKGSPEKWVISDNFFDRMLDLLKSLLHKIYRPMRSGMTNIIHVQAYILCQTHPMQMAQSVRGWCRRNIMHIRRQGIYARCSDQQPTAASQILPPYDPAPGFSLNVLAQSVAGILGCQSTICVTPAFQGYDLGPTYKICNRN